MIFDRTEYEGRIAKARASMARHGIDVLVECDPANMFYLTGYDGWSFYIPQAVILPLEGAEPLWIGRGLDLNGARLTTFLKRENILAYPEDLFERTDRHPMQFFAGEMERCGWAKKTIGITRDCQQFTTRSREALIAALPNARFVDCDLLVNRLRLVKSPAEIAFMSDASRITERIMATFFEEVQPGVRECDVSAEVHKVQTMGTSAYAGDYPASIPFFASGPQSATTHLTWTDRRFTGDETVSLQASGVRARYHSPMARTMHLGKPPQKLVDMNAIVLEGMEATLAAARPGVTCEAVEAVWRAAIARHGLTKESRIAYPVGIGYPPDWGERTASFRPGDRTILEPNMTFHLFLGMWMEDWGFAISETIRITDTGAAPLANVPRGLHVKS
jgi:ectoine hydrolase